MKVKVTLTYAMEFDSENGKSKTTVSFALPDHPKLPISDTVKKLCEEDGKPLCLLRRLAIALGIHDELKVRPDSQGFWWMLRPCGEWHIGRAEVIHWGEEDSGERVLAWTAGGIYSRCDMMNTPKDSGTRWAKAMPPILESNA